MKTQFAARVKGQFVIDGKTSSEPDLVRVLLAIRPTGGVKGRSTIVPLIFSEEEAKNWPLKKVFLFTAVEGQTNLFEQAEAEDGEDRPARGRRAKDPAQRTLGLVPPGVGKVPDGEESPPAPRSARRRRAGAPPPSAN